MAESVVAVELGQDARGWVDVYRDAAARIRDLETLKTEARRHIEEALAGAEEGKIDGRPAVRISMVESTRLDVKAIRRDYPDVVAACSTTTTSPRLNVLDPE